MAVNFKETLSELTNWLQTDGRVSRRAVKRHFDIDEEYLEDLIDSLIYAHPVEVDDRGLMWNGEIVESSHVKKEPESIDQPASEAERRQLTVMFCDLADSTGLAQSLDPEDLRYVIRTYQQKAAEIIHSYGGHVAQYLGDGLLVYFGWPKAHEDDARRAVLSATEIVKSISTEVNPDLMAQKQVELTLRVGIHTGLVVVGQMGGDGRYESLATGETVNICARLEGLARPNGIVVSHKTGELVRNFFNLEDLGERVLKGVKEPVRIYSVIDAKDSAGIHEATSAEQKYALVGRDEELGLLRRRWEQVTRGHGQVVLVNGIAGIGKSSLVNNIRTYVSGQGHPCLTVRCSPYHQNSALFPLARLIEQTLEFDSSSPQNEVTGKLRSHLERIGLESDDIAPLLLRLLKIDDPQFNDKYGSSTSQKIKQLTLDAVVSWLFAQAMQKSLLVVWEDLHWADPSTLELIGTTLDQTPTVPMLSVMTYRSEFIPQWRQRSHITPITLNRLELAHVQAMIENLADHMTLPQQVIDHIVEKTDGVPLFVEELTKMILDSEILVKADDRYELSGPLDKVAIPDTLQDSLLARLDQLNTAKEAAQMASVLGREFQYALLSAIYPRSREQLDAALGQLEEAELLYRRGRIPDAVFVFKHALVQDAAYATLLKTTRQELHKSIAGYLEEHRPDMVRNQPEVLAHHLNEAGKHSEAIAYWLNAAEIARENSSHAEAIAHARKGLRSSELINDESVRKSLRLKLYLGLGPSMIAVKGYADDDNGEVYRHAKELATQIGDRQAMYVALFGLSAYYLVRAEHAKALSEAQEMKRYITDIEDPYYPAIAVANGMPLFCLTRFHESAQEFETGLGRYNAELNDTQIKFFGLDFGVFSRSFGAPVLWQIGKIDRAMSWASGAVEFAEQLAHPFSKSLSRAYASVTFQMVGDVRKTQELAASTVALSKEQKFPYYLGWGMVLHGWATGLLSNYSAGVAQIRDGMRTLYETGGRRSFPYYYALEAEVHAANNRYNEAILSIEKAFAEADEIQEFWWLAEINRLKGEYLLRTGQSSEAHASLEQALAIAREQKGLMQELRALCSLARHSLEAKVGNEQNTAEDIQRLVDQVEGGESTPDVVEAHRVLSLYREIPIQSDT